MKKTLTLLLAGLLGIVMLTGCAPAGAVGIDLTSDVTPAVAADPGPVPAEWADALAGFGWDLLRASAANDGSLLVSPASVHLALAMTQNGADTDTLAQMLALLAPDGAEADALNDGARAALARWNDPDAQDRLSIANSIWFDQGFTPDPVFLQANADHYTAAARALDFAAPDAPDAINRWVKEATRGVIPSILDRIPDSAMMYLVNAVHFKAEWVEPFDKADTRLQAFRTPAGEIQTDFMHRSGAMRCLKRDGMSGVMLPYLGGRFAFFAILPDGDAAPRDLLGDRSSVPLRDFVSDLQADAGTTRVDLALPKFETEYKDSLKNELAAMGMGDAFSPDLADFSRMQTSRERNLFIGEVLHKTFCRVDEKGTEAAAVTAVQVELTSMPAPGVAMTFDRPFLYGIVDLESSIPLFLGIQENPAE
ncbi:MAG: serpin family protein [Clostridia bacterium]|nr:serpin family protein [Clostridia bacterium]